MRVWIVMYIKHGVHLAVFHGKEMATKEYERAKADTYYDDVQLLEEIVM